MGEVTLLLAAANAGDREAGDRAFALVYADLRTLARRQVQRAAAGPGATSLVHEVYLRLVGPASMNIHDREHFFALAARAMRQLVVDHARRHASAKRGGGSAQEELDSISGQIAGPDNADRMLELDQALDRLAALDPDLVRLVEMRYFAGLELTEIASVTGRSERSLKRDWRRARVVLHATLEGGVLHDG
jgi:RNA polymerase sigma factor (TIGR02999 family)